MLELTGCAGLRTSTVHMGLLWSTGCTGLQELTERISSRKLKEHICLLGLTWDKGLQTLRGIQVYKSFDTLIVNEGIDHQLLKMILLQSSFLMLLNSDVKVSQGRSRT